MSTQRIDFSFDGIGHILAVSELKVPKLPAFI